MAYDIEEQEQLDALKAWWVKYGNAVMGVAIVVALAAAAWNGWNWYQRREAGQALAHFEALQKAVDESQLPRIKDATGTLLDSYGRTEYAPRAALLAAKAYADAGDAQSARAQLQWVIDKGHDEALAALARLRLAGMLLDAKNYDDGLKALSATPPASFAALYADRRGDILLAQGKRDDARGAYKEAIDKLDPATDLRSTIQLKLDSLGGA